MMMYATTKTEDLDVKIEKAIRLLQSIKTDCLEVSYSGGKDSDVILALCRMAGVKIKIIHKCTTIDPPGTLSHCKQVGADIIRPEKSMFEIIRNNGFPTRRSRHCCGILKEYKVLPIAVQGIRKSESVKRRKLYKEPIICRTYGNKKNKAQIILPILEWSDKDVELFVKRQNITLHPIYYNNGQLDMSKRLGCIGCPMASDNGLSGFKNYPKMVKAWIDNGKIWWDTHPNASSHFKFKNIYEVFVHNVFFNSYEKFKDAVSDSINGPIDCKTFLENYFNIKL